MLVYILNIMRRTLYFLWESELLLATEYRTVPGSNLASTTSKLGQAHLPHLACIFRKRD